MANVLESVRGMSSTRLVVISLVGVALLVTFGFLSLRLTSPVMSPLYGDLETEDATAIAAELGAMAVAFQVGNGGKEILVPSGDMLTIRMALAQKGLPSRGSIVGYEIFDQSEALGTSSFVNNVNYVRALEGELGRTIGAFSIIRSARVHLVIPKRQLFKGNDVEPSASVALTMQGQQQLKKEEIAAISNLIATAVPGLKLSRITIVDNTGKLLARGSSEDNEVGTGSSLSASTTDEYRRNFELRLKNAVEQLLESTVGLESVRAEVSAEIAFDRVVSNAEIYDPEGQVVRSVQTSSATETSGEGQDQSVSAINNLPGAGATGGGAGNSNNTEKTDEVTNFEISKTITNRVSEVGSIKRLSVAVLVDGKYEVNAETGERTYTPRSDEDLEKIRTLTISAIGYDEKRGDKLEIVNMPFSREAHDLMPEEGALDWLKKDLDSIIKTLVMGVVAILAILLVVRPLVNRVFEAIPAELEHQGGGPKSPEGLGILPGGEAAALIEGGGELNVDEIQGRGGGTSSQQVSDLVASNPEQTLALIRNWLGEKK